MSDQFPIFEVPDDAAQNTEAMGSKYKFWFQHPELGECLFKQVRPSTGEDWSEKIAAELCQILGLPCARYELATWKNDPGTISPSMLPKYANLQHGNDILSGVVSSYPSSENYSVSQHTLDLVLLAIRDLPVQLPLNWHPPQGIESAVDTFVGYLLLDTWIGNTDRHHENWGFVTFNNVSHLAPTYDHASSLGRELLDSKRQQLLSGKTVEAYARKARSALYAQVDDRRAMLTLEAFCAIARRYPKSAIVWLERLSSISSEDVRELLARVPSERLSPISSQFACQILEINKSRLIRFWEELL